MNLHDIIRKPIISETSMEEIANKVIEANPVEFMGGMIPVDLTDTSEDGQWAVFYNTGLKSGEKLTGEAW